MSAAVYVRHTFSTTDSATLRKRVVRFMTISNCTECNGKRLKAESLAVKVAGFDIADLTQMPLSELRAVLKKEIAGSNNARKSDSLSSRAEAAALISNDLIDRIGLLSELGLDYLAMDRPVPTLSAGELQRLRLATQLRSGLFGIVYVSRRTFSGVASGRHGSAFQNAVAIERLRQLAFRRRA